MKKDIFEITNDTMGTINKGYFINNKNEKIEIKEDMTFSISNTKFYFYYTFFCKYFLICKKTCSS